MTALLCLYSCDGGDDDGRRLGEVIVGTWQRDEIISNPRISPTIFSISMATVTTTVWFAQVLS